MTTQIVETVDSLYEDVAKSKVCGKCRSGRPRYPSRPYGQFRKVRLFQLTPDGVFHMALPKGIETLCGRDL